MWLHDCEGLMERKRVNCDCRPNRNHHHGSGGRIRRLLANLLRNRLPGYLPEEEGGRRPEAEDEGSEAAREAEEDGTDDGEEEMRRTPYQLCISIVPRSIISISRSPTTGVSQY